MKNIIKLLGITALTTVIGFSMIACDSGGGGGGGGSKPASGGGGGTNTVPKSIRITGITLSDMSITQVGVWVFAKLPQDNNWPANTAIQYGDRSGSITFELVVPRENTWNSTTDGKPNAKWTGNGDYYVLIVPIINNAISFTTAYIFTDGGDDPVKVAFNQALVTLAFSKFKSITEL